MRLYSGLSTDFIRDNVHPAPSEVNSWRNSLKSVSMVLDDAKLHDHGIPKRGATTRSSSS